MAEKTYANSVATAATSTKPKQKFVVRMETNNPNFKDNSQHKFHADADDDADCKHAENYDYYDYGYDDDEHSDNTDNKTMTESPQYGVNSEFQRPKLWMITLDWLISQGYVFTACPSKCLKTIRCRADGRNYLCYGIRHVMNEGPQCDGQKTCLYFCRGVITARALSWFGIHVYSCKWCHARVALRRVMRRVMDRNYGWCKNCKSKQYFLYFSE